MEITLPAPLEETLTAQTAALDLAIGLYTGDHAGLAQAAEIAGLTVADFMKELGRRDIPLRYDLDDLAEDLATVRALPRP